MAPLIAFELGNELVQGGHINTTTLINDYLRFNSIMETIWPNATQRPAIFGPAAGDCEPGILDFLNATKHFIKAFTFHSYPAGNGSASVQQLLDVNWLRNDILYQAYATGPYNCIAQWKAIAEPYGVQLWLDESNSAYLETYGEMMTVRNGFWYTASLGQYALYNVSVHCRWCWVG